MSAALAIHPWASQKLNRARIVPRRESHVDGFVLPHRLANHSATAAGVTSASGVSSPRPPSIARSAEPYTRRVPIVSGCSRVRRKAATAWPAVTSSLPVLSL